MLELLKAMTLYNGRKKPQPFPSRLDLERRRLEFLGNKGKIICFFTKGTLYEAEKNRLERSATLLGLEIDATAIDSVGDWVANCSAKAAFLARKRRELRGPLFYLDVDSVLHQNPWAGLQNINADVAIYRSPIGEVISATIWLNDTPGAQNILDEWTRESLARPREWDQRVLSDVLLRGQAWTVEWLPVEFCWIFDNLAELPSGDVFVEQLQASRETRFLEKVRVELWFKKLFRKKSKGHLRRLNRTKEIEAILFGGEI